MDPIVCALDLCTRTSNGVSMHGVKGEPWLCYMHVGAKDGGLEFYVLSDPETGDDAYIYSGVQYHVGFRAGTVRGIFIGVFDPNNPLAWRVTFKGFEGEELDVAVDVITSIAAT